MANLGDLICDLEESWKEEESCRKEMTAAQGKRAALEREVARHLACHSAHVVIFGRRSYRTDDGFKVIRSGARFASDIDVTVPADPVDVNGAIDPTVSDQHPVLSQSLGPDPMAASFTVDSSTE